MIAVGFKMLMSRPTVRSDSTNLSSQPIKSETIRFAVKLNAWKSGSTTSSESAIALIDLAKGGDIIRSQTYSVYLPYLTVAAVYLMLVMTFTWLLGKLERHLRNTGADPVHNDS